MNATEADSVLELAHEVETFKGQVKELEDMVAGRDQNIAERAEVERSLRQRITVLETGIAKALTELGLISDNVSHPIIRKTSS